MSQNIFDQDARETVLAGLVAGDRQLPEHLPRVAAELAINGASPAFAQPLHVGRPSLLAQDRFLELTRQMLSSGWLTNNGPLVQQFESELEAYLGVRHCVSVCNGTIAMLLALRALDLTGEVILPSYSFIATASAVEWMNLTPVFADIDPTTHNLSARAVADLVTEKTSAILPVHLWGNAADIPGLQKVAEARGLHVLYDTAHGFASTCGNRRLGGFGDCEVFSFHATKFFHSIEGGAVTTNDDALADRLRKMRNFGFAGLDHVVGPGINGKLSEVHAAMGLANLSVLERLTHINRRNYVGYADALSDIEGLALLPLSEPKHNNHQYVVLEVGPAYHPGRDRLLEALRAENILARRYFWPGIHRMPAYTGKPDHQRGPLPHTEAVADRVIVLPTGPGVGDDAIEVVAQVCRLLQGEAR